MQKMILKNAVSIYPGESKKLNDRFSHFNNVAVTYCSLSMHGRVVSCAFPTRLRHISSGAHGNFFSSLLLSIRSKFRSPLVLN